MPKKCESCRFYYNDTANFDNGFCTNQKLGVPMHSLPILRGREQCDREGDGVFIYFEPNTPAAGRAFGRAAAGAGSDFTIAEDLFYPHTEIEGYREGDNDDFLRG